MVTVAEVTKPKGNLESYSFPTSAEVDKDKDWSLMVHNNGTATGNVGAGIANLSGNPGNIVVTYAGTEHTIEPGYILILHSSLAVCSRINPTGKVRFKTKGKYTIRLAGLHQEGVTWYIDTYVDRNG